MAKDKIGLLTLPIINNYGGIIQLAALYNFLESNNYNPIWIDKRHQLGTIKRILKKIIEVNPFYKVVDPKNFKNIKLFYKQVQPFFHQYLSEKTPPIYSTQQLKLLTQNIDSFVVGSDQVWRFEYTKSDYPNYFLEFVPQRKKKIAYAASFGKDYWEGNQESIDKIKSLIKKFNKVTIREDSGINVCKETFDYEKAIHVLDPSFLTDISFYESMIKKINISNKIELFNYVLDSSDKCNLIVKEVSKKLKLKTTKIYLNNHSNNASNLIENWLAHFYYSDFVITDSFHGMVFSIIFNKQFIVIGNQSRGLTRFNSLLKLLDLEDRIIKSEEYSIPDINKKIDYHKVNIILNVQKEISRTTLLNSFLN